MSTPHLANEILQHIIVKLAEGPREDWLPSLLACSTTNSALLQTSQMYIFREVALYSHPTGAYDRATNIRVPIPGNIRARCRKTLLFLRVMDKHPHLGSYVKDLTYRFSDGSVNNSGFVLGFIRRLKNVERLSVGIYTLSDNAGIMGIGLDQETISTVIELMRRPQFRTLELRSVLGFPLESLRAAPGLRNLSLHEFTHVPGEFGVPSEALTFMPRLESLMCDSASLQDGVNFCLAMEPNEATRIMLSRVQKVDLRLTEEDIQNGVHASLLQQAECLREIDLTVSRSVQTGQVPSARDPPLQRLHPASFKTLTRISLGIATSLQRRVNAQDGLTILDPYFGMCDAPLTEFVALETLNIKLAFLGSLDVHVASSFGAQWGVLPDLLTTKGTFLKLKTVTLTVAAIGGAVSRENHPLANLFVETVSFIVRPQFHRLEVLHSKGLLDFAFSVRAFT